MEKDISVIIPAYNAQDTIKDAIESIKSNTVEIIVVVDGATDHTLEICKQLQETYRNLKVLEQENKRSIRSQNNRNSSCKGKICNVFGCG